MPGRSQSVRPRRRPSHKVPYSSPLKASQMPAITRSPTPSVSIPRGNSDLRKHSAEQSLRFMVNLEELVLMEEKLCGIAEGLRVHRSSAYMFEEWWLLTGGNTMAQVPKLFRDERLREVIKEAQLLEVVSVALAEFCFLIGSPPSMMLTQVQTLVVHVHQSFLVILSFLLTRLQDPASNPWAQSLHQLIASKRSKKSKQTEGSEFLRRNNSLVSSIVKSVCRMNVLRNTNERARAYRVMVLAGMQVMRRAGNTEIEEVRRVMQVALDTVALQGKEPPKALKSGEDIPDSLSLPPAIPPFLPPQPVPTYCLVLDLDETLIHYFETETCGQYFVRPGLQRFLSSLSPFYEIVVFTAALQDYADWIIDEIDPAKLISHRLYRQHTVQAGATFIKDLEQLGRDLKKTIIVDNVGENFQLQPRNGILIRTWYDDPSDDALGQLVPMLQDLVERKVDDVRVALMKLREEILAQVARPSGSAAP